MTLNFYSPEIRNLTNHETVRRFHPKYQQSAIQGTTRD